MLHQLLPLIVIAPFLIFWVWMFRDFVNNPALLSGDRALWLIAFVLLNIPAAFYYYLTEYKKHG